MARIWINLYDLLPWVCQGDGQNLNQFFLSITLSVSKGWPKRIPQQPPTQPAKKSQDITEKGKKGRTREGTRMILKGGQGCWFQSGVVIKTVLLNFSLGNCKCLRKNNERTKRVPELYWKMLKTNPMAIIREGCGFPWTRFGNRHYSFLLVPWLRWSRV